MHFKKTRLISFILSRSVPARSPSATWHRFAFLRQMNIPAPSGNSMATAQSPLYGDRDVVARTPAPLSRFIPSLFIALSLETSSSTLPPPLRNLPVASSRSFSPCDKTLPRLITFIIRPSTLMYLSAADKARKEIPCLMTKVATDRRTHQWRHFTSFVQLRVSPTSFISRFFYYYQRVSNAMLILIISYLYSSYT